MKILITNDDGYDAPGLVALYNAVKTFGDVTVVAPSVCHSSRGHAVEVKRHITVEKTNVDGMGDVHVVDSSPADCTRIGLHTLCDKIDLVVAGVNPGANLGVDVYYSGTVAAAREAAIARVPAIAISRYMRMDVPLVWDEVSKVASKVLARVMREDISPEHFWNVNLPAVSKGPVAGLAFVPHSNESHSLGFEPVDESAGKVEYQFNGPYQNRPANQPADVRYVFDGYVTATRLKLGTSVEDSELRTEEFDAE